MSSRSSSRCRSPRIDYWGRLDHQETKVGEAVLRKVLNENRQENLRTLRILGHFINFWSVPRVCASDAMGGWSSMHKRTFFQEKGKVD